MRTRLVMAAVTVTAVLASAAPAMAGPTRGAVLDACVYGCSTTYGEPTNPSWSTVGTTITNVLVGVPIENGGFESPDIPTGTWGNFSSIPGWTPTNSCGIEVQDRIAGSPYQGGQFVELNSNCRSGIAKIIPTTSGVKYAILYAFSPRPGTVAGDNAAQVKWNGTVVDSVGPTAGSADTTWVTRSVEVTGTGSNDKLKFVYAGTNPSGHAIGAYIDAVSVWRP